MPADLMFKALSIVLLLFCLHSLHAGATDEVFLLVHKRASISKLKSAEHVTVSIRLHNVGFSAAYDVALNDDKWPSNKFHLVNGNFSNSWDKLEAGKSVDHVLVLESREKGLFHGAPAVVRYRVTGKSALQEAYSTPIHELDLLSEKSSDQKFFQLKESAVKYGPLLSVLSVIGLFAYLLITPSKSKAAKLKKRK